MELIKHDEGWMLDDVMFYRRNKEKAFQSCGRGSKRLSRVLYEEYYGEIPNGSSVSFKDGDWTNIDRENLYLKSRGETVDKTHSNYKNSSLKQSLKHERLSKFQRN